MKAYRINKWTKEKELIGGVNTKADWFNYLVGAISKEDAPKLKGQALAVDGNDLHIDIGDLVWSYVIENCTVPFLNSFGFPGWWLKEK